MTFKEIQDLVRLINKSNLTEFKMKDGDFRLSIRTKKYGRGRQNQVVQAPQQQIVPIQAPLSAMPVHQVAPQQANAPAPSTEAAPAANGTKADAPAEEAAKVYLEVKSPMVGTFYRSPSPDKGPYKKIGDDIAAGDVVCIVEAMKLFNEIESEVSGKIVKVMIDDASPVEYDQVLFLVDPDA